MPCGLCEAPEAAGALISISDKAPLVNLQGQLIDSDFAHNGGALAYNIAPADADLRDRDRKYHSYSYTCLEYASFSSSGETGPPHRKSPNRYCRPLSLFVLVINLKVQENVVWYQVPRQAGFCGTVMTTNSTHAIYSNNLFLYPISNTSQHLVLPEVIPFSCAYPLEIITSLNRIISPVLQEGGLQGSGTKATASMYVFRDSDFTTTYPEGQIALRVGTAVHVGVFVTESDPTFALVLDDCYTSPSSDPDDPIRFFLIHSRCPTNPQVSVVENGASLRARFSVLFFPRQGNTQNTFLHCRLSLCDNRNYSCVPLCTRRTSRSVSSSAQLSPLTIGPITWEE
ncbi:hypothetical protein Q5P01_002129 [Channa striata]|uniref:ZP domain-containing protein n=1 Tax=Channa striata TaxID=64152 RepID=A0AA88NLY0_CHASR|nr:hypothetical protein Q5P01_002129 [Channa striata]